MGTVFKPNAGEPIKYHGMADLLAQVADELANRPDSCFAVNCRAWYNSLYRELSEFDDCRYQVETPQPSTLGDLIDILVSYTQGQNRRVATVALRVVCREAQRVIALDRSSNI